MVTTSVNTEARPGCLGNGEHALGVRREQAVVAVHQRHPRPTSPAARTRSSCRSGPGCARFGHRSLRGSPSAATRSSRRLGTAVVDHGQLPVLHRLRAHAGDGLREIRAVVVVGNGEADPGRHAGQPIARIRWTGAPSSPNSKLRQCNGSASATPSAAGFASPATETSAGPSSGRCSGPRSRWRTRRDSTRTHGSPTPAPRRPGRPARPSTSRSRWPRSSTPRAYDVRSSRRSPTGSTCSRWWRPAPAPWPTGWRPAGGSWSWTRPRPRSPTAVAAFLAVDSVPVERMTKKGLRTFDCRAAVVALAVTRAPGRRGARPDPAAHRAGRAARRRAERPGAVAGLRPATRAAAHPRCARARSTRRPARSATRSISRNDGRPLRLCDTDHGRPGSCSRPTRRRSRRSRTTGGRHTGNRSSPDRDAAERVG